jgi:riboflavin kinase
MEILDLLLYLGKKGAVGKPIAITTSNLGKKLDVSQQTISRWLITLEKNRMISRKRGFTQITPAGKKHLQKKRDELNKILTASGKIVIQGEATSGMFDGKYYMSLKGYSEEIKSRLRFKPYPGTLNIRLNTIDDSRSKEKLVAMKGVEIPRFRKKGRTFGSVKCFPCIISGVKGAVIIPERSHYGPDILEVISPIELREKLKLSDGDPIKVEVIIERR